MSFLSADWFYFSFVVVALFHCFKKEFRKDLLLVASIFFPIFVMTWEEAFLLYIYVFIGYLFNWLSYIYRSGFFKAGFICIWLLLYVWLSGYLHLFLNIESGSLPVVIGISYILFRVLQVIIEANNNTSKEQLSFSDYTSYTLNWLTFLSGPIHRKDDYIKQISNLDKVEIPQIDVLNSVLRITKGMIKVLFFAYLIEVEHKSILFNFSINELFIIEYSILCVSYLVYLYFNFSGYMDVIVGIGNLLGLRLSENFNNPFLARNFLEFWDRWHITLSSWMKDYFYIPLLTFLVRKWPSRKFAVFLGIIVYFTTFTLLGIWHGVSNSFIFCGLMLGLGAGINALIKYMDFISNYNTFFKCTIKKLMAISSPLVSFAHISISITGFWLSWDVMLEIATEISVLEVVLVYILTSILCSSLIIATKVKIYFSSLKMFNNIRWKEVIVGFNIFLVIYALVELQNIAPKLVYQGF